MDISTYFIKNNVNGLIKIGKSNDVNRRIGEIKGHCSFIELDVYYLVPGDFESQFHSFFKKNRVAGEWFEIPELTKEMIEAALTGFTKKVTPDRKGDKFISVNNLSRDLLDRATQYVPFSQFLSKLLNVYGKKDYDDIVKFISKIPYTIESLVVSEPDRWIPGKHFIHKEAQYGEKKTLVILTSVAQLSFVCHNPNQTEIEN